MTIATATPATPASTETTDAYFTLPTRSKPSKAASSDKTRPVLTHGNVTRDKDGSWFLEVTDSYCLARVPLGTVGDPPEDWAGLVSREALLAIERPGAGAFGLDADRNVVVRKRDNKPGDPAGRLVGTIPATTETGSFPNLRQLIPDEPIESLRVGINPDLLRAVDAASGGGKHDPVVLRFDLATARNGGCYLRAIYVECNGAESVVMPIRVR